MQPGKIRRLMQYWYRVPWAVPGLGWAELRSTVMCLITGRVRRGRHPVRFAEAVKQYLGVAYAIPVNRGRTAIEVGLRGLGIGAGHDVVVPSYICESVVEGVVSAGARPVFADVGSDLHVTVDTVRASLTPATRCVIVAHLFGSTAPIDEIERVLQGTGIALMDDAAQALGARRAGRMVGTFGACGIVSCGPGKPLAGAAGGCLVTNDAALNARAAAVPREQEPTARVGRRALSYWLWRRWRRVTLPLRVVLDRVVGFEREPPHTAAHLANLDAAIAVAQLRTLERRAATRRENARHLLATMPALSALVVGDVDQGLALKLIVALPEEGPTVADATALLARLGLECQPGYTPCHLTGQWGECTLTFTEQVWKRVLCIPVDSRWRPRSRSRAGWPLAAIGSSSAVADDTFARLS
jgi:dTDP-4-amino-4,6-dideoxygalactose transaminase